MLIAVLEKRMGLAMGSKDVYVNLVGGFKVDDPALDLSIISSIASSTMDKPIDQKIILCGEVGLAGEVRSVNRLEYRLSEAAALGFDTAIVPVANMKNVDKMELNIGVQTVKYVKDVFQLLF